MSEEAVAANADAEPPTGNLWLWAGLCAALLTVGAIGAAAWLWSTPACASHAASEPIEAVAAPAPPQHSASAPEDMAAAVFADAASAAASAAHGERAVASAGQSTTIEDPMQRLLRRLNELAGVHVAADTSAPGELRLTTRAQADKSSHAPAVR